MIFTTTPDIPDNIFPVYVPGTDEISLDTKRFLQDVIAKLGYSENLIVDIDMDEYIIVNYFNYVDEVVSFDKFLEVIENINVEFIYANLTPFEVQLLYKIFCYVRFDIPFDTAWVSLPFDEFDFIDLELRFFEEDIAEAKQQCGVYRMNANRTSCCDDARYAQYCDDLCAKLQDRLVTIMDGYMSSENPWVIYCLDLIPDVVFTSPTKIVETTQEGVIVHTPYIDYEFISCTLD